MTQVSIMTLGCKTNQYEAEKIAQKLLDAGVQCSLKLQPASYYILNTCSITAEADKKSRQLITRALKFNKSAKVIVIGCASQKSKEAFNERAGVLAVFGVADKNKAVDVILDDIKKTKLACAYVNETPLNHHRQTYLKIQDGCNNFCTYCIVPYLRGRSISYPLDAVIKEAELLSKTYQEIVITGINLSVYNDNGKTLTDLALALSKLPAAFRFSSLEPRAVTEDFLRVCQNAKNFVPHFHMSMQSGCDETLRSMNRKYTAQEFLDKIKLIRKYFPKAYLACDIIAGFPTETDEHFAKTLQTVQAAHFDHMHIFPFSPREGTPAFDMKAISHEIVENRCKKLQQLVDKK